MNVTEEVRTGADVGTLHRLVADLGSYPSWLGLVVTAEPADGGTDEDVAWSVELRGRIGPLARSKRLRMVRTAFEPDHRVVFERAELDGRTHADWTLEATITEEPTGSLLTMHLHYGGSRFAPVLAPLLREEIRRARGELQQRYPLDASAG